MKIQAYGHPDASVVLIQPVDRQELSGLEGEVAEIQRLSGSAFQLIAVEVDRWNHALSPWAAPPVFGREGFGGGAENTLEEILRLCGDPHRQYILGGYSLAGLFALWAACQTDVFFAIAAASPSVWFPGFSEYLEVHPIRSQRVYLSLGDREEKTRNPVMATVGDRIRGIHERLSAAGTDCVLEWNRGNHFQEAVLRTARAFAWALDRTKKPEAPSASLQADAPC